jgi:alkyl sulfatase BDS1-like metallo-beta-lactamase superfamily hydrolase
MADLLELSARIIDAGRADEPVNRVTQELSALDDDLAVIESFSHVVLLRTGEGLVAFDTSGAQTGGRCVEAMRRWSGAPVSHLVYTHGHIDHVGGSGAFVADAEARGHRRPVVVAHENVPERFDRYTRTDGWNTAINRRQFGWLPADRDLGIGGQRQFLPAVEVADGGDLRLACHLVELAGRAAPDDHAVHAVRAEVYERRRTAETSLMAKGIYASAMQESQVVLGEEPTRHRGRLT